VRDVVVAIEVITTGGDEKITVSRDAPETIVPELQHKILYRWNEIQFL
jgi:hypothetical protein